MARLLPHITMQLEDEITDAVRESNDGYPQHLNDLRDWYDFLTDEDIGIVADSFERVPDGAPSPEAGRGNF